MMPALTRPTTITVVADELWIIAVTTAPSSTLRRMLLVSFSSAFSIRPPASFSKPLPITLMP